MGAGTGNGGICGRRERGQGAATYVAELVTAGMESAAVYAAVGSEDGEFRGCRREGEEQMWAQGWRKRVGDGRRA